MNRWELTSSIGTAFSALIIRPLRLTILIKARSSMMYVILLLRGQGLMTAFNNCPADSTRWIKKENIKGKNNWDKIYKILSTKKNQPRKPRKFNRIFFVQTDDSTSMFYLLQSSYKNINSYAEENVG